MDENTYQVIITNSLSDDQDKLLVTQKLATLFKTSEQKAAQLLTKPETIVKKNIDQATAEKYQLAIRKTGAQCKIINSADEILPEIDASVTPPRETETPSVFVQGVQSSVKEERKNWKKKNTKNSKSWIILQTKHSAASAAR